MSVSDGGLPTTLLFIAEAENKAGPIYIVADDWGDLLHEVDAKRRLENVLFWRVGLSDGEDDCTIHRYRRSPFSPLVEEAPSAQQRQRLLVVAQLCRPFVELGAVCTIKLKKAVKKAKQQHAKKTAECSEVQHAA